MPKRFLILSDDSQIIVVEGKPGSDFSAQKLDQRVFGRLVPVYCPAKSTSEDFEAACIVFEARTGYAKLFRDVHTAKRALQAMIPKGGSGGFLAVGASSKLVKWALKSEGFKISAINVSAVKIGTTPTKEFLDYLDRKLKKLEKPSLIIIFDFADTGASLIQLQSDVQKLAKDSKVLTAALGTAPEFHAEKNKANKEKIDHVIVGIGYLEKALYKQELKFHVLGRNKVKNPYSDWSEEKRKLLDETPIPHKGKSHEHFQKQKKLLPHVMNLEELKVDIEDFLDPDPGDERESGSEGEDSFE